MRRILYTILGALLLGEAALLLTGYRLLLSQKRVDPGQVFIVKDYGNLGDNNQSSLVCRYFTGRGTVVKVFWYSPNNLFGKDDCPFLLPPAE